ncbi:hypothetical protein ACWATR_07235 [Nostoc sp. UIC 10890]
MHPNQIRQKTVVVDSNLEQGIRSEVKIDQAQMHEITIRDLAISLSPVGFIIGWIGFFLILQKIRAFLDEKMVLSINSVHKLPCKNCRFYSNNHYLKCAVNPSIVLTEEAMSCSEYSSSKKKFSSKNPLS